MSEPKSSCGSSTFSNYSWFETILSYAPEFIDSVSSSSFYEFYLIFSSD